jgi:hypothetical protein
MCVTYLGVAIVATLCLGAVANAAPRDGAIIHNSGSTNTVPYDVLVWSDGTGRWIAGARQKDFTIASELVRRFLKSAQAARANPGAPQHCMKSASFGTRTTVTYHGWTSDDMQCPPIGGASETLARDTQSILDAAGIAMPPRRIRLPMEPRRLEEPTSGTPSVTPSSEPSARTGGASRMPLKPHAT